jgi:hypothetical protein
VDRLFSKQATGDGSRRLKTGLFVRRAAGLRLSDERVRQSGSKDAHRNAMVGGLGRANRTGMDADRGLVRHGAHDVAQGGHR